MYFSSNFKSFSAGKVKVWTSSRIQRLLLLTRRRLNSTFHPHSYFLHCYTIQFGAEASCGLLRVKQVSASLKQTQQQLLLSTPPFHSTMILGKKSTFQNECWKSGSQLQMQVQMPYLYWINNVFYVTCLHVLFGMRAGWWLQEEFSENLSFLAGGNESGEDQEVLTTDAFPKTCSSTELLYNVPAALEGAFCQLKCHWLCVGTPHYT